MPLLTGDYETYYDQDYSLRKLTEAEYLTDPRYETIMLSLKVDNGPTDVMVGHEAIARRLAEFDWSKVAWLSHNTRFDGAITSWKFGHVPALYLDTLGMARATVYPYTGHASLEAAAAYLGLPPKGHTVQKMVGVHLADLLARPNDLAEYKAYGTGDSEICYGIFQRLRGLFSREELALIDMILRMFIQPSVRLNPTVLAEHLAAVRAEKAQTLAKVAHVDKSVFSSNVQFAKLLESYGVQVPMKVSKTTGLPTYALARNDREFKELCADPAQPIEVQAILAARTSAKSTLEETRSQTLLNLSLKDWSGSLAPVSGTGWAPVPLKYAGAHTLRLSGDGGTNWQNFGRKSRIREAIEAPPGYRILHRDASQIEARMVAYLARCEKLVKGFAAGEDIYSAFATDVYGYPVRKCKETAEERHVGKTSILGLGYGMGAPRFRHTLFVGIGGPSVVVSDRDAERIVRLYRNTFPEIPELWRRAAVMMAKIAAKDTIPEFGTTAAWNAAEREAWPSITGVTPGHASLWFPDKLAICYPKLRFEVETDPMGRSRTGLVFDGPRHEKRRIFGGMAVENIAQRLARTVVLYIAVRVAEETQRRPWMTTHDSLDYCVPLSEAEELDAILEREFSRAPDWAPGLPLASEGGWGTTLKAAESMENR